MMTRRSKRTLADIGKFRRKEGVNQLDFWSRYGVSQSGGSRYESGRAIPKPLAALIRLHHTGKISDKDLEDAMN